ncbi:MAG: hypothetical protein IE928_10635 [Gammaproteobacteria bacterium]|nr:hypothetical protein [Gammaproteobacteria bacterium]
MNLRLLAPSLMGVFLLQGCGNSAITGIPDSKPFAPTAIEKPRSIAHWKMIANETVNYLLQAVPFEGDNGLRLGVFIALPTQPTEFERAYFSLLSSQLSAKGVPVLVEKRAGALVLNYVTQVVAYEGRDGYHPFQASALATTGVVLSSPLVATVPGGLATVVAGESLLASSEAHSHTNCESLLSVSLQKDDWLLTSWSKVLSIHANDAPAYVKPTPIIDNTKRVKIDG